MRLRCLSVCAVLLSISSGCLFVRHSTHVVRESEKPQAVQFESPQAQNMFDSGVAQAKQHKESSNPKVLAVPLVCWYSRADVLSDNAVYNDQILVCDTNGDRVITNQEAYAYSSRVAAQHAAKPASGESSTAQTPTAPWPVNAALGQNVARQ